jgi:hypothetical protein
MPRVVAADDQRVGPNELGAALGSADEFDASTPRIRARWATGR